jgi:hypothetical protein
VNELELDLDSEHVSVRRVGRVLGKMRWRAKRTTKTKGWTITMANLQRWALAYGVAWPRQLVTSEATPLPTNGIGCLNGITAQGAEDGTRGNGGNLASEENESEVFWL